MHQKCSDSLLFWPCSFLVVFVNLVLFPHISFKKMPTTSVQLCVLIKSWVLVTVIKYILWMTVSTVSGNVFKFLLWDRSSKVRILFQVLMHPFYCIWSCKTFIMCFHVAPMSSKLYLTSKCSNKPIPLKKKIIYNLCATWGDT